MMIGFYERLNDVIRINDIVRIGPERDNGHGVKVRDCTLADERSKVLFKFEADEILRRPVQLIPAQPGTQICRADPTSPSGPTVYRDQLIAWALCLDGEIRVVTPAGVNDGCGEPQEGIHVEMPDGKIVGVGEYTDPCAFDDADAMLRHFVRRAKGEDPRADEDNADAAWEAAEEALRKAEADFASAPADVDRPVIEALGDAQRAVLALEPRTIAQAVRQLELAVVDGELDGVDVPKLIARAKRLAGAS